MCRNFSTNRRPGNGGNSVEYDQKLIRPGADHNVFDQTWVKSDQQFVCKCVKTDQQIGGRETTENPWCMTKSWSGSKRPIMSCSTKFLHNPISDLCGNVGNHSTNPRTGNGGNLMEYNQHLIGQETPIMSLPTDFGLNNPISCLSADAKGWWWVGWVEVRGLLTKFELWSPQRELRLFSA